MLQTSSPTINFKRSRKYFVKDNFSKACPYTEVLMDGSSFEITNLLKSAFEKYTLYSHNEPVNIVCDGGPENKGDLDQWISGLKHPPTIKLTAQTETFPFSNNMSESIHHIFKNIFLRDCNVYDRAGLILKLKEFEFFYGHILYPLELYGFTSQQVLNGAIPDKHRFALQIENSQKMRAKENHATVFCKECYPSA